MNSEPEKRILFVDDEPNVLRAIRRGLRRQRNRWHMKFAEGATEALKNMAEDSFDIVVTDVTMPRVDGVTLLSKVRKRYPDTVRIMMSGTAEGATIMKAVPVAHRFLSKPWNVEALLQVLERAFELRTLLSHSAIRSMVGGQANLPSLPENYQRVCRVLEEPGSRLEDIVAAFEHDPAIVARLLHIVNSAFFAPPRPLRSATDAIRYLGTSLLKNLVLAAEVFSTIDEASLPKGFSAQSLQEHALMTARIATRMCDGEQDAALSASLLHEVGKLILAKRIPDQWGNLLERAKAEERPLAEVEYEVFGASYAEVGAYLLGLWGLPQDIVEAVAYHRNPMRCQGGDMGLVSTIHVASTLAAQELGLPGYELSEELIEHLGDAADVDGWRAIAKQVASPADSD